MSTKRKLTDTEETESEGSNHNYHEAADSDTNDDALYIDVEGTSTTMTTCSEGMMSATATSLPEAKQVTELILPTPPATPAVAPKLAPLRNTVTSVKSKTNMQSLFRSDAFVTYYVDKGKHQSRFLILPSQRLASSGGDKLAEFIKKGGGIVFHEEEENLREEEKKYLIKIMDMDFVKSNIHKVDLQNMPIPYDCFSSSFIWSQFYHKSVDVSGSQEADLNIYRISPSAHLEYNANGVLNGSISWDDISLVPSDKLSPTVSVKEVALKFFPELLCSISNSTRKRRAYTREESQQLLDEVCELDAFGKIHGVLLYNELSRNWVPNRSSASLREHFRKTILPHVILNDGYYKVSEESSKKFKAALEEYESRPKRGRKKQAPNGEKMNSYILPH